jgi:hypothetical protein
MRRITTPAGLLAVVLLTSLAAASPALAASPWWHLTSAGRPTDLRSEPGLAPAKNEVQEVVVSAAKGSFSFGPQGFGELFAEHHLAEAMLSYKASAVEVQKRLERLYGAGNVQVGEGEGDTATQHSWVLTFIGALAAQKVPLVKARGWELFGPAECKVIEEAGGGSCEGEPSRIFEPLEGGSKPQPEVVEKAVGTVAERQIVVTATNLGDASTSGPVTVTDKLPPGLEAAGIVGSSGAGAHTGSLGPVTCSSTALTCTFEGSLPPYEHLEVVIGVVVRKGAASGELNEVSVSGGEGFTCAPAETKTVGKYSDGFCTVGLSEEEFNHRAEHKEFGGFERTSTGPIAPASVKRPIDVSEAPTPFGVQGYELTAEEEGGAPDTQAGSHPFQLTTTLTLNQVPAAAHAAGEAGANPAVLAKDLSFRWPAGLIGNPNAFQRCTMVKFFARACPVQSAVGVSDITYNEPSNLGVHTETDPVFNLEPSVGEPARFAFLTPVGGVFIDPSVRTGEDYGITVHVENITQSAGFFSSVTTVWGSPGDPRHDSARGYHCLGAGKEGGLCSPLEEVHPPPFLSLPTSCTGSTLASTMQGDSWKEPGVFTAPLGEPMPALDGCNRLPFAPEIKVAPDGQAASTPTGMTVDVHVPQEVSNNATGIASSNIRDIKVIFPRGVTVNPASADGLLACSEAQIGYLPAQSTPPEELLFTEKLPEPFEPGVNFCPDASKVGTVTIRTPLLPNALEGSLYLAAPAPQGEEGQNPFKTLLATYIVAKDPVSGSLVKLPGKVLLDQETGQIVSTFENTPQLAFEDAEIHLFGGERAPFSTPAHCGTYTTEAQYTPWSGTGPVKSTSSFKITTGPNGGPCPGSPLPFVPSLASGSPNINAGAFTPLSTTIGREDGNQAIRTVVLHYPPGLSGMLSGVKLCGEPQADEGKCGPESLIGEDTVSAGLGNDPITVPGAKIYITGPYNGAPFGLSIVNPAKAGPFDLVAGTPCDCIVDRAKIEIDPTTAALTVTTDSTGAHVIPHILDGIPLQLKHINVLINRPGFTFNPTNCNPMSITGTIGSDEGASATVSVPFQVTNCAALKFAPKFTVSTNAKTSKAQGASLTAKVSEPAGAMGTQSNITKVKVDLPKQLPSQLKTLQKACLAKVFEANPAGCPAASIVGHARVITPLLPVPLVGPAYFVSHGNEEFPSLTMVLQGYGVTVQLVGSTFISKAGITSSTFKTVPDVPFNTFELTLPQGKYAALAAHLPDKAKGSFCGQKLLMPTLFVAQNGAEIHQNTPITVTGCKKAKKAKKSRHGKKASGKRR